MTIDIINYTDEQFAELTEEQILEVEEAQLRKNRLTARLEEDKRREKYRLLEAGVFRSPVYEKLCDALEEEYDQEVESIRDALLFYLRFASRPSGEESAPYPLDYSLDYAERLAVVKGYYDETYSDPADRFAAFTADKVARNYLGEAYAGLYDLYADQAGV